MRVPALKFHPPRFSMDDLWYVQEALLSLRVIQVSAKALQ